MRYPDTDDVKQLTQKLQEQNDITLEESDWIYSLYTPNTAKTKFNRYSSKVDTALINALEEFYDVVIQKIQHGHHGNFLFSVLLDADRDNDIGKMAIKVQRALGQQERFEDFFTKLFVSAELYNSFPKWLKQLFSLNTTIKGRSPAYREFYVLKSSRIGMYYRPIETEEGTKTIAQYMKKLSPATRIDKKTWDLSSFFLFELAVGVGNVPISPFWWLAKHYDGHQEERDVKAYVVGTYLKYKEVPLMLMENNIASDDNYVLTLFTERDKVRLVKSVLNISFENLVQHALYEKTIDEQMAKNLLSCDVAQELSLFHSFAEASIKCIDKIVQREMSWNVAQKTIEEDDGWLEIGDR
jgi:hypothetical protein